MAVDEETQETVEVEPEGEGSCSVVGENPEPEKKSGA